VTDLERRAQADKIRQENVRKEKEMLKELEAAKEKERLKESEANKEMEMLKELDVNKEKEVLTKTVNTDNAAAASETEKSSKMPSANRSKPPTQSIPKPKISEDKLPKSTTPSKRKSTSQVSNLPGIIFYEISSKLILIFKLICNDFVFLLHFVRLRNLKVKPSPLKRHQL